MADTSLTAVNGIKAAPAPPLPPILNFTNDGVYGSMLRLILDYSAGKKDAGTWIITNPKANPPLTSGTINDLILIAHYEVTLV